VANLGEAARWLGYSGKPSDQKRNAKAALLKLGYKAGSDYRIVKIHDPVPQGGFVVSEQIRLTAECFKDFCLQSGAKRASLDTTNARPSPSPWIPAAARPSSLPPALTSCLGFAGL
jgi:hypothetical protein